MSAPPSPLVLVDGTAFLFRAFHAVPPFTNARGEPTGALLGFVNMLRGLLAEHPGERAAVVFDAPGPTFRDEMFPDYKANRPPVAEELAAQFEPARRLVDALGLPLLCVPGVEADDVMATLAARAAEEGMEVLLVTSDKDMAQMVDERVRMLRPRSRREGYELLDPAGVERTYGVPPARIVDFLALTGDSVDNVPGVPRVGPKTAARWLAEFGSLDDLVRRADEVPGKVGESLRASLDHLPLSRRLVTVRRDVPLDRGPRDLAPRVPDAAALAALYERLEFRTLLAELDAGEAAPEPAEPRGEYEVVLDRASLDGWLAGLAAAPLFAFDTETTSLDYMRAEIVGLSFAVESGRAAYVPVAHRYPGAPDQLDRAEVLEALRPLLQDPKIPKVGQNLKYDRSVLARHGVRLEGIRFDTMLESYVLDSTGTRHDMDSLAAKYLGYRTIHYEEVAGKGAHQIGFDQVPLEQAGPYAAEDADVALRLHQVLWPALEAGPRRVYETIEAPLVPVLSRMERRGVRVDARMLAAQSAELATRMLEVERAAMEAAGEPFKIGSTKQIQAVLFDRLGLPVTARTPKGQPSTTESVLQDLADRHPLPGMILEHRGLAKLKSTYTDALPARIDTDTGRVHTSYHQAVASTGRLSSSDPNLQNIPTRTPEGRRIRQAFVAAEGHRLLAADYSQIELRIMAHLSGDPGLCAAFAAGADVHAATAAEVFGGDAGSVDREQRRRAKAINFGLIYGMSAFGLARQLGIPQREAQAYIERYFSRYPGVKQFMDDTREAARERGYVETVFGRRLHVPDIASRNAQRRQYAERTAINAPMQGTAADIIKLAMIDLDGWLEAGGAPARMIMQVHDELVFEVEAGQAQAVGEAVRRRMCAAADLAVPLVVDVGVGDDWDEAH